MDQDTGRPKGFAFVEFHDASSALAAIRHLDGHEVNSRRLRVSYSNNSNLKEVAQTIGPDAIPDFSHLRPEFNAVRCTFLRFLRLQTMTQYRSNLSPLPFSSPPWLFLFGMAD